MLVIHPDECIDCSVCEPECPVDAIFPDSAPELERWLKLNAEYAAVWPNVTTKREPAADFKSSSACPKSSTSNELADCYIARSVLILLLHHSLWIGLRIGAFATRCALGGCGERDYARHS
jgi:ferredoxin